LDLIILNIFTLTLPSSTSGLRIVLSFVNLIVKMYFSLSIISSILLLLPLATAKCYGKPVSSVNKQLVHNNIESVCKLMQGHFRAKQPRDSCITDSSSGTEWRMGVTCINKKMDGTLTLDACKAGIQQELDKCSQGGHHKKDDFEFW
jgi:hypothetical protein